MAHELTTGAKWAVNKLHTTKKNEIKPLLFRARNFRKEREYRCVKIDLSKQVMLAENEYE
jgi:hypothetical protein